MILDASNLGQIIGRLQYGAHEPAKTDVVAASAPARQTVRTGRGKDFIDVLGRHPEGLRARQIAELAGVENVSIVNAYLAQMPEVEKSGKRGTYLFKLKGAT